MGCKGETLAGCRNNRTPPTSARTYIFSLALLRRIHLRRSSLLPNVRCKQRIRHSAYFDKRQKALPFESDSFSQKRIKKVKRLLSKLKLITRLFVSFSPRKKKWGVWGATPLTASRPSIFLFLRTSRPQAYPAAAFSQFLP